MEQYSKYSGLVTDIIRDTVPLFEKASIDEFYVDMTGMDKFFGCNLFTTELKKKVLKESGLPASYGLASNKGYGAPVHMAGLDTLGVTPEHRRTYAPVRERVERTLFTEAGL